MTRETKIGLLVGLAFIIVIGILLSDHLTTRGELPAAQLTQVGDNVRVANAVPAGSNPPITPVAVPNNVVPTHVVATHDELNSTPPSSIVQIGPSKPTVVAGGPAIPSPVSLIGSNDPVITQTPPKDDHAQVAIAGNTTPGNSLDNDPPMLPVKPGQSATQAVVLANNLKPVKAEKGDTVSKLAAKYLGGNTNSNRQAILDANPGLKADPAKIVIGHTYMIPAKAAVASATESPAIPDTVPYDAGSKAADAKSDAKTSAKSADKAPKSTTTTYTVKSNDTLWKIANGDPAVLKEIQDLNKDVLKGKATVHPGLTLKVPAKTSVASR